VKAEWVVGTARVRIPYLGWVRLGFSGAATTGPGVTEATTANDSTAAPTPVEVTSDPTGAVEHSTGNATVSGGPEPLAAAA
jgi:signal peptidase